MQAVAFVEVHVRSEVPPAITLVEDAVNVSVGVAGVTGVTVTVTDFDTLPPAPEHVSTYVVFAAGVTF